MITGTLKPAEMVGPATPAAAYRMISIPEALSTVLSETVPLPAETVPFHSAFQHTLAEDVSAAEPVPGYRASIKDGYAVVSADGPGEYVVASEAHAGSAPGDLQPGTVAYVGTGGPVPKGADAVVQIEDSETLEDARSIGGLWRVKIYKQARPGEDIREVGSDLQQGEIALRAGQIVGAAEIGILATVGAGQVSVRRKPHVAVLSTGDEVTEPAANAPLPPGKIRDANRAMLLAAASGTGAKITDLGIAADSKEKVKAAFHSALAVEADVLLVTGGVSMGDKDFVKPLLADVGTVYFGKVRMKPGKPLTFAKIMNPSTGRPLLAFGLPGNPASSLVTFHLIVVPCLRKLEGWADPTLRRVHVRLAMPIKMDPERPEYHRAIISWVRREGAEDSHQKGEFVAESTGGQISSRILSLRSANALLEVPAAKGTLPAGARLTALLIGDLTGMPQPQHHPVLDIKAP